MRSKRLKAKIQEMYSNQDLKAMMKAWSDSDSKKSLDEAYQQKFSSSEGDEDGRSELDTEADVSEKEES